MKFVVIIISALIILVLFWQFYSVAVERNKLNNEIAGLNQKVNSLNNDNATLKSEIEYLSHPENLQKEAKSQSNLRKPDEKLMIIVP